MLQNYQTTYNTPSAAMRSKMLRNTYALLGLSLIPTVIGAMIGVNLSFAMMRTSPIMSVIIMMVILYGLMFAVMKNRYSPLGAYLMFGLTFIMGVLLGPILQVALRVPSGGSLIMVAGGATSLVFLAMAFIGATTKREMSGLGNFLSAGAIVLIVAIIANIFLQMPVFQLVIAAAIAFFSSLMILWQVKNIVDGGETSYIAAALNIYISIYNLFTSILQLLLAFSGSNRN